LLKVAFSEVEELIEKAGNYDPDAPVRALAVFDFS